MYIINIPPVFSFMEFWFLLYLLEMMLPEIPGRIVLRYEHIFLEIF